MFKAIEGLYPKDKSPKTKRIKAWFRRCPGDWRLLPWVEKSAFGYRITWLMVIVVVTEL